MAANAEVEKSHVDPGTSQGTRHINSLFFRPSQPQAGSDDSHT